MTPSSKTQPAMSSTRPKQQNSPFRKSSTIRLSSPGGPLTVQKITLREINKSQNSSAKQGSAKKAPEQRRSSSMVRIYVKEETQLRTSVRHDELGEERVLITNIEGRNRGGQLASESQSLLNQDLASAGKEVRTLPTHEAEAPGSPQKTNKSNWSQSSNAMFVGPEQIASKYKQHPSS